MSSCFDAESVLSLPFAPSVLLVLSVPFDAPLCCVLSLWLADFVLSVLFELSEALLLDWFFAGGTSCTPGPFDADGAGAGVGAGAGAADGAGEGAAAAWFCALMLCCSVAENGSALPALLLFDELLLPDVLLVEPSSELINEKGDMLDLVWSCQCGYAPQRGAA